MFNESPMNPAIFTRILVAASCLVMTACAEGPKRDLTQDPQAQTFLNKNKVYLSVTTSPLRISKIHKVFDSIDLEHVENIFLNVPMRFGRDNSEYDIPDRLLNDHQKKVKLLRPKKDLGPITKLLPAIEYLQKKGENDAVVIIIDDDRSYPRGMVAEMVHHLSRQPKTVFAGSTHHMGFWGIPETAIAPVPGQVWDHLVVEGFGGIGFSAGNVDVALMKKLSDPRFSKECYVSDDMVISFALALSGVERSKIDNKFFAGNLVESLSYDHDEDALSRGAGLGPITDANINTEKYQACHRKMMDLSFDPVLGKFKDTETIKADWDRLYGG